MSKEVDKVSKTSEQGKAGKGKMKTYQDYVSLQSLKNSFTLYLFPMIHI